MRYVELQKKIFDYNSFQDLLKRVLPYECLSISTNGSSRRTPSDNSNRTLSTVAKTIEYFNAVVARVIATILKEQDEQIRANVIEKWIDVAHQCRKLKNFSSLTAILNGLLSGCIYRLTTAWSHVNGDYWSILEELKNVFGSCADRKQARAILDKVRIIISIENRLFFVKYILAAIRRSSSGISRVHCRFECFVFCTLLYLLCFYTFLSNFCLIIKTKI